MNSSGTKKEKIGYFGGTFDPIHFGHINLALEILEKKGLDQIWISPSFVSPFRQENPPISGSHRQKMIELVIEDYSAFRIYNKEILKEEPSYTISTIRTLKNTYPDKIFYVILGEDQIPLFAKWKDVESLVKEVPCLVGYRGRENYLSLLEQWMFSPAIARAIQEGGVKTRIMEISSTEIRQRIKNKLNCSHLVPPKVLDYIYENQLYSYTDSMN